MPFTVVYDACVEICRGDAHDARQSRCCERQAGFIQARARFVGRRFRCLFEFAFDRGTIFRCGAHAVR